MAALVLRITNGEIKGALASEEIALVLVSCGLIVYVGLKLYRLVFCVNLVRLWSGCLDH